jgi:hypothetical protein
MTIELIYYPLHSDKLNLMRKRFTLQAGSKIEDVLSLVHAKGLAVWSDKKSGRGVVSNYQSKGLLKSNGMYFILSGNIRTTIEVLKKL